jgi:hypothetical protein
VAVYSSPKTPCQHLKSKKFQKKYFFSFFHFFCPEKEGENPLSTYLNEKVVVQVILFREKSPTLGELPL